MATVIDSFVLEFGLDPSKFTAGQRQLLQDFSRLRETAGTTGKEVEAQAGRVVDLMQSFRREALTTLGLFFGGRAAGEFLSFVTNLDAATSRFSRTINMNVREVSAWQGAFQQIGGTAESANAALGGLSGEMNRFQLTGQSNVLPVLSRLGVSLYDQNRHLKTAGALWLDLADAVQGMDAAQATAFLSMIPGANQDMINFALLGRRAMQNYIEAAKEAGGTTAESAEEAKRYQQAIALLDRSAASLGRTLVTAVEPALVGVMDKLRGLLQVWNTKPGSLEGEMMVKGNEAAVRNKFGTPEQADEWLRGILGGSGTGPFTLMSQMLGGTGGAAPAGGGGGSPSPQEMESYIRAAAVKRGMNPDVAVAVAKSEGLYAYQNSPSGQSFIPGEQSFGPFQLHYGGGLGDTFTRQTGLNARDPSTWKNQVDFALDQANAGGWGPWHGWKGARFAGIGAAAGGGGSTSTQTSSVSIGSVTIVAPNAKDADSIAREITPALKRSLTAGAANYGQQ